MKRRQLSKEEDEITSKTKENLRMIYIDNVESGSKKAKCNNYSTKLTMVVGNPITQLPGTSRVEKFNKSVDVK